MGIAGIRPFEERIIAHDVRKSDTPSVADETLLLLNQPGRTNDIRISKLRAPCACNGCNVGTRDYGTGSPMDSSSSLASVSAGV